MMLGYGVIKTNFASKLCNATPVQSNFSNFCASGKRKSVASVPKTGKIISV
jgi:hypothetical protein